MQNVRLQGIKETGLRALAVLLGLGLARMGIWLYFSRPWFKLILPDNPGASMEMFDTLIIKGSGAFFGVCGTLLFLTGAVGMNDELFRKTEFGLALIWRVLLMFGLPCLFLLKLNEFLNLVGS